MKAYAKLGWNVKRRIDGIGWRVYGRGRETIYESSGQENKGQAVLACIKAETALGHIGFKRGEGWHYV
jgi:hypothetical protein